MHLYFQMNAEKLSKLQAQVRIGGKVNIALKPFDESK